jgi:iron complex outermembrane recepter protein
MGTNRTLTQAIRLALAVGAVSGVGVSVSQAQTQVAQATATGATSVANATLEEVVVTGTRISKPDFEASAPTVSVNTEFLINSGAVSLDNKLNALPQLTPDVTTSSNNPSDGGFANVNLRGLGPKRTLVLVDGRRAMPQDSSGVIDLNSIPASLIERVDILSGGASSSYGSDAVAGVVNIIMKHNFEGAQVDVGYGWDAEHGDGKTRDVSLTLGSNFADGKGNSVVALSYDNRDPVLQGARGFSDHTLGKNLSISGSSILPGGRDANWYGSTDTSALTDPSNSPTQAGFNAAFPTSPAGACPNSSSIGFNPGGSLFCRQASGPQINLTPGQNGVGGDPAKYNFGAVNYLQIPSTRKQVFQEGHYNPNDNIEVYDQVFYTGYTTLQQLAPSPLSTYSQIINGLVDSFNFSIPAVIPNPNTAVGGMIPNPIIPAPLAALLATRPDPNAAFGVYRRTIELGDRVITNDNQVYQMLAGVKGNFAVSDHRFDWNVFGSYGYNSQPALLQGDISISAFQGILNGTEAIGGCNQSNFSVFGIGSITPACQAAVGADNFNQVNMSQSNWEGTIQTDLFKLGTDNPVTVVLGADWRKNTYQELHDHDQNTGDSCCINTGPVPDVSGQNVVKEFFTELALPVLADLPGVKRLDADVSYRYSDYDIGGAVSTYGGTLNYKPVGEVKLRASYAHAARAPTLVDLFSPPSSASPGVTDPCDDTGGPITAQVQALCIKQGVPARDYTAGNVYAQPNVQIQETDQGNGNLKPETSNSFTFGVVFNSVFPGDQQVTTSLDYWNYHVKNEISNVGANNLAGLCFNQNGANPTFDPNNQYCLTLSRDANGDIVNIYNPQQNLGDLKTAGIDWELDYGLPMSSLGLPDGAGKLSMNLLFTYLMQSEFQQTAGGIFIDTRGTLTDVLGQPLQDAEPKVKGVAQFYYTVGGLTAGWQSRFIAHMIAINDDGTSANNTAQPRTPSYVIHRLSLGYNYNKIFNVVGGVENLFNKQPPIYTTDVQAGVQANTDPSSFDTLGRRFFVNLSYKF